MTETPLTTPFSPALRLTRRAGFALGGGGLLVLCILFAVSIGAVAIPLSTVWGILANNLIPGLVTPDWTDGRAAIVWDIRFPRALLAALVGAGLGLTGAATSSASPRAGPSGRLPPFFTPASSSASSPFPSWLSEVPLPPLSWSSPPPA
jgi:iron complex transport system permease protein